jgi:hypothetical protein
MEKQGLKPSFLMGKLKQHLPHDISPDKSLYLSTFLICLLPSMWEAVGARNHLPTGCSRGHPKNGNYHAIWLVHAVWAL